MQSATGPDAETKSLVRGSDFKCRSYRLPATGYSRTGQAPYVKGRHALKYRIRQISDMCQPGFTMAEFLGATGARRSRTGQALITAIIFFLIASIFIVISVSAPALSGIKQLSLFQKSNQIFYSAESSIDDVSYRLKNGLNTGVLVSMSLNDAITNTTVTDVSGGKQVNAQSNLLDHIRKMETRLKIGDGVAFHYGIQTGNGGFVMGQNAGVYGNVYSNGDITGASGSFITGSAIAANSPALLSDQANITPEPPAQSIVFGQNSDNQDPAQSFIPSETLPVNKVKVNLKKIGSPGNLTVRIAEDISGSPSSSSITSTTLSSSLVTTNFGWIEVVFPTNPDLTAGNTYWVVLDGGSNVSKYYEWGANTSYPSGLAKIGRFGVSWADTSPAGLDGYFEVYLGGLLATISGVSVGQDGIGDAHAHTVNNSIISGNLFCQTGTGNNKSCTSKTDPSAQSFPVSDANIDEWKNDAEAGVVINGNYVIYDETDSVGPAKINGDLTIDNNANLILTGTIWVTGNIYISNNAGVSLDPGYATAGGILLSDGYISLSNNVVFSGSGQANSYLLLLTTSDCPQSAYCEGNYAIDVQNNVDTVVLNAQKGTINFSNNAGANAGVAKTLNLQNNSTITYISGLADLSFSSGPSGGYEIDYWKEVP